ncbi:MAG TPA: hypothetical protein VM365_02730, partial [Gemmatimonadales bacterium]|nr:hypothetical protein [Gemmatimonadales bacterium]
MRTFRLAIAGALTLAAPLGAQTLTGAGATFPNPIYTKWFDAYSKQTGVQINYQSIGSGGGGHTLERRGHERPARILDVGEGQVVREGVDQLHV